MTDNTMNVTSWISEVELEETVQTSSTTESKTPNPESKTPDPESKTPDPESKTPSPAVEGACALPTRYAVTVEADKVRVEEVTNNGEAILSPGNEVAQVTAVDQLATALNKVCKDDNFYRLIINNL